MISANCSSVTAPVTCGHLNWKSPKRCASSSTILPTVLRTTRLRSMTATQDCASCECWKQRTFPFRREESWFACERQRILFYLTERQTWPVGQAFEVHQ